MTMSLQSTLTIAPNVEMPIVGLGVFRAGPGDGTVGAVLHALRTGYRHIDTASIYRNEEEVGAALRTSEVARDEIFVTTKLWNDDHGYDEARHAFDRSLETLGVAQVDLYLIHWPVPEKRKDSWRALEAIFADGQARAIGVSNYTQRHLTELLDQAKVPPAVNQVECHPFLPQTGLRAFCAAQGITVQAYSPLTKGKRLDDPTLQSVATKHGRTAAQVLLRWGIEQNLVILPKSSNPQRIDDNAAIFDFALDESDHEALGGLADDENGRTAWDPTAIE
ncbi:MAG: aldo/keto reductase [Myxococcota bacterium]